MKKSLTRIFWIILIIIIIVIGIVLGMPRENKQMDFEYQEPILYIKYHANLTPNTDFETLNNNYLRILNRNGIEPTDIRNFIKESYIQNENIYTAKFISDYGDVYILGFNLNTNQVALKKQNN